MQKYFRIIGVLELISWIIGMIVLIVTFFTSIKAGFSVLFPIILSIIIVGFLGPAVGFLFLAVSALMEDVDHIKYKEIIKHKTPPHSSNSTHI